MLVDEPPRRPIAEVGRQHWPSQPDPQVVTMNDSGPRRVISVVIPTLNEEQYVGACLQSIQDTSGDCVLETIVVDNGSTDGTAAIAERHGACVLHVRVATIAAQRNLGACRAKGELLAFLDADCTVVEGWAQTAVPHFADTTIVAVGAPPRIPASGTTWLQRAWSFLKQKKSTAPMDVNWMASANLWVRRASFNAIRGFDEELETCEDADLGYRLTHLGRIVSDPRLAVVHHREARTLREFYRKEVWHGKNSFDGLAKGRLRLAEVPSLLVPVELGASVLLACIGIWLAGHTLGRWFLLLGLTGVILAPALYSLRACLYKGRWCSIHRFTLVYFVYFFARFDALLRALWRAASSKGPGLKGRAQ